MLEKQFDNMGLFIPVKDLERSAVWYNEILGLHINHWDRPEAVILGGWDDSIMFCLVKCEDFKPAHFPKNNYEVDIYYNFHATDVDGLHKKFSDLGV